MRFRGGVVAMVVMVTLAACSSGGEEAVPVGETTSPAAPTPPSPTAPTSSEAPPSAEPPASVAGAAAPTTTEAVTATTVAAAEATAPPTESTLDPNVQARLDVIQAVQSADRASALLLRDPGNDALLRALSQVYTGDLLEGFENLVQRYRAEGLRTVENSEVPDSIDVDVRSVRVGESLEVATLQACDTTSDVLIELGGNRDGGDRVVDDRVGRIVLEFRLVNVKGEWLVADAAEPLASELVAECV